MYIEQTNSTNTLLKELLLQGEKISFIRTDFQTNGRGQTGNGWESEKGQNILCSLAIDGKQINMDRYFDLSVRTSVAVHRVVAQLLAHGDYTVTIKWPNDIYVNDYKIAGILIETALSGQQIAWAIAGIGLNINQTKWLSNAPNPTSIQMLTGEEVDIEATMNDLIQSWEEVKQWTEDQQWQYYKSHLYRGEGYWPFVEREVNINPTMNANADAENQFIARIADISPDGEIILIDTHNKERKYHFKQIRYIIQTSNQ